MIDPGPRHFQGKTSYLAGLSAEEAVWRVYQAQGLTQAARRWRGASGEIDMILRDTTLVVFVEVKKSKSFDQAAASLSQGQMTRLLATASEFLSAEPDGLLTDSRFDVALVDGFGQVRILENALMS